MSAINAIPHGIHLLANLCVVFAPAIEIFVGGSANARSEDRNLTSNPRRIAFQRGPSARSMPDLHHRSNSTAASEAQNNAANK
jgi:hypothetical protein